MRDLTFTVNRIAGGYTIHAKTEGGHFHLLRDTDSLPNSSRAWRCLNDLAAGACLGGARVAYPTERQVKALQVGQHV